MKIVILSILMHLALGCQAKPLDFNHALIERLSIEELNEVKNVIATATGSTSPLITDTAFTDSHILVLEHAVANTPKGRIATGRTMGKPETFHLLSNGKQCALLRVTSGQRYPLTFKCDLKSPGI